MSSIEIFQEWFQKSTDLQVAIEELPTENQDDACGLIEEFLKTISSIDEVLDVDLRSFLYSLSDFWIRHYEEVSGGKKLPFSINLSRPEIKVHRNYEQICQENYLAAMEKEKEELEPFDVVFEHDELSISFYKRIHAFWEDLIGIGGEHELFPVPVAARALETKPRFIHEKPSLVMEGLSLGELIRTEWDKPDKALQYAQAKTHSTISEWEKDTKPLEGEKAPFQEEAEPIGVLFVDEVSRYEHFMHRVHASMSGAERYGKVLYGSRASPLEFYYRGLVGMTATEHYGKVLYFTDPILGSKRDKEILGRIFR